MSSSSHSSTADSQLINAIVLSIKSRGIFDDFRRQCLSDADTKPSFQNLLQRVEGYVSKFLSQQKWNQNINKNQLRERLRTQINESGMLKYGIEHLVEQVVNYKINSLFWPQIESVVKEFLGITETSEKPSMDKISDKTTEKANEKSIDTHQSSESWDQLSSDEVKKDDKNVVKSEENNEIKTILIKEEPTEDMTQPMDIATDSNDSICLKKEDIETEDNLNDNENLNDSDNEDNDWPTPPQPELLTPERQQLIYSPIETNKSNEDSNVSVVKKDENEIQIKENESFLINKSILEQFYQKPTTDDSIDNKEKSELEVKDEELSDVSSVHTSDLSDFDDEISLDDSNDEQEVNKKKRISLKVVKKITEVLSSEHNSEIIKRETTLVKQDSSETSNTETVVKSESKRVRRVNPKYSSEEFSSIFTERERSNQSTSKDDLYDSEIIKTIKTENEHKINTRKRRNSNGSDDNKEVNDLTQTRSSKSNKKRDEIPIDSRSSSRGSIESCLSETTQDSIQSHSRSQRRRISKNRNESQTQRYESSDLYKPRPVISSRRARAPTTPDSSIE